MKLLKTIFFWLLMCMAVTSYAIDNEIQKDILMSKITSALKAGKAADALLAFSELEGMESSLKKTLPESFDYYYIDTLDKSGDKRKALSRAEAYLSKHGKKGKHYGEVIDIMSRLQDQVAQADKEAAARGELDAKKKVENAYKSGEVGIRKGSRAEDLVNKMKALEKNDFKEWRANPNLFKSNAAKYYALWDSYYEEVMLLDVKRIDELSSQRERLTVSNDKDRISIDLDIRVLNHEIAVLYKRPNDALSNLYQGMEKYSLNDLARDVEDVRLFSLIYSKIYFEYDEDHRGHAMTFNEAELKHQSVMESFEKIVKSW